MAKRVAIRFHKNPALAFEHRDSTLDMLQDIYHRVADRHLAPSTIAEWIALALFTHNLTDYQSLRNQARRELQAAFVQAERWLQLIDEARLKITQ